MFTASKKGLIHLALSLAIVVAIGQCAWASFNENPNKLALNTRVLPSKMSTQICMKTTKHRKNIL